MDFRFPLQTRHFARNVPAKIANYMMSRAATIYGGAKEIQKNIIAKLAFGL